jgi:hypothetical protein
MKNSDGVTAPLIKPYPAGSNSMRTAGIVISDNNNTKLNNLTNSVGGYRKTRRNKRRRMRVTWGGVGKEIIVPPVVASYPEVGAGNQTVAGNVSSTTSLGATTAANSVYDGCVGLSSAACAAQTAGGRKTARRAKRTKRVKSLRSRQHRPMRRRSRRTSHKK